MPNSAVLIGWSVHDAAVEELGVRLAGWVKELGYAPTVLEDGGEIVAWVRSCDFAASLLDCGLSEATGERVWRTVRPIVGRRLVLMAREPRRDIIFEALRFGVGAVLRLPPRRSMVEAALQAATGRRAPGVSGVERGS